jgi:rod shape-determining protein MreC
MSSSPFKRLLYAVLSAVLLLALTLNIMRVTQPALLSQQPFYPWLSELQYALVHGPSARVRDTLNDVARLWALRDENRLLRRELDRIASHQAALQEAYRDIEALREFVDLKLSMSEQWTLSATVIERPSSPFLHTLVINIGENDGVEVGDAVLSPKGLIGRVSSLNANSAVVILLTTENDINKLPVKIQISETKTSEAILERYNPNEQAFELRLLETDASILEGMRVISSGAGGRFPSGLLVGRVSLVENLSNALGLRILVRPAADFYRLDYVLVVKRGVAP